MLLLLLLLLRFCFRDRSGIRLAQQQAVDIGVNPAYLNVEPENVILVTLTLYPGKYLDGLVERQRGSDG